MGVKIREIVKSNIIKTNDLMNSIVAVDASNILAALIGFSSRIENAAYITDRTQKIISHLYGLLYRVSFYYSNGILPIFCFDGRDSELKRKITKDLLADFLFSEKLYQKAIERRDLKAAHNIALSKEYLWTNVLNESRLLLGAMGVPIIESPASAEAQCAHLVSSNVANFAVSQDYDILVFGCPRTVQNLSKSRRRKQRGKWVYEKVNTQLVDLNQNLRVWGIDRFQLVDMTILVGNDYFSGVQNLGAKRSLSLVKKNRNLEKIIQIYSKKYDFTYLTHEVIKNIRKIFLFPDIVNLTGNIHWNAPDTSRVVSFLCQNHHLNRERVEKAMSILSRSYYKCLTNFKSAIKTHVTSQKSLDIYLTD
ncbi:MAG: hypothetical protein JW891_06245 [Candidatus Lokiarchaeota archaeon]|nr:hypothetical protein [Candidatus Lokiarchaeota archaeon]